MLTVKNNSLTILLVFVSFILTSTSATFAAAIQWETINGGNGHWYEVVVAENGILWQDANLAAEEAGGYLATVTSAEENDFIYSIVNPIANAWDSSGINTLGPWLGGYQLEGSVEPNGGWSWITGEEFLYTYWGAPQPNNNGDFLNIYGNGDSHGKQWNDFSDECPSYVIEYVPEPTTFAILLCGGMGIARRKKQSGCHCHA